LQIFENAQISNYMKIRPVGAELFHADRRTDIMKLIIAFRNFANASKILKPRDDGVLYNWMQEEKKK